MGLTYFNGYFFFEDFQAVVNWLFSYIPIVLIVVFLLNCIFNIIHYFIHIGGK